MPRSVPFIGLLVLIGGSAFALGSDTPAAALFFSAVIAAACAALCIFNRGEVGGLALFALLGAAGSFLIGAIMGWTGSGAGEYAALTAAFGVFAAVQIAARDSNTAEALWRATLVGGLILGAISFLDFIVSPAQMGGFERPYHRDRLSTPFLSANTAATFFGVLAIVSLSELIRVIRRFHPTGGGAIERLAKSGALPVAALLVCLTCVFLTASRAGATFLAAALLMLTVWELFRGVSGGKKLGLTQAAIMIGAVGFAALVFAVSGDLYADRFTATFERADGRETIFPAYLDAIHLAPWFGHGLGGFVYINALIAEADNARELMNQGAAHNIALQWLLQGGIIGLAFVAAVSGSWLAMMRRGIIRRSRQTGYVRAAVIAALFVVAHAMVDYALEIPAFLFLFAWVCGLGAGVATGGSKTLGPGGGRKVARAITYTACAILFIASGLSFIAFSDRASANAILSMGDETFISIFEDEAALSGSAVRSEAIGDRALRLEPVAAGLAARAFEQASEREPRDGVLEAKFAYARFIDRGTLTPDAAASLARSYLLMPYGARDIALWRLAFVEAAWPAMPASIRQAAIREARVYLGQPQAERLEAL